MPLDSTEDFLAGLSACGLLTPDQLGILSRWVSATAATPQKLAKEINNRGWLTAFQIREIYQGRGANLILGKYILLELLGEGGMGRVYKARDSRLDREVALKVIRKDKLTDEQTIRRFHREIQAVSHLNHPNVVLALDADEWHNIHFCAMEYVDGTDLTRMVKTRGPLPQQEACEYVRQVALGLQHAHERGMVHRDVKPSNVMVTSGGQVKLLDMGLALLNERGKVGENRLTQVGFVIGTPDFLAPEQAQDPSTVDIRADIYSLGCTLYFLLTGRPPYEGTNATEKLIKHVTDPIPSIRAYRPDLSPSLDALVQWMMAKRPEERPQTPIQAAVALLPFCIAAGDIAAQPAAEWAGPLFQLPVCESPARIREQSARSVSTKTIIVATVAFAVLGLAVTVVSVLSHSPPILPASYEIERLGLTMVRLPGGTFVMGSPDEEPGRRPDEGLLGDVTISGPFFMATTEITNSQFLRLMGRSPAVMASRATSRIAAEMPVDSVTWSEAVEFCRRLTEFDGQRQTGWAYRLPTEAEWEYACRAGSHAVFGTHETLTAGQDAIFTPEPNDPLGEGELEKPPMMPSRVAQTQPNPFGLFDLHGNVWEWCADYYDRSGYPPGPRLDPTGPETGELRVVRGGGYLDPANRCRCAVRQGMRPTERRTDVGFRVVFAPIRK
jgi:serine/threonine protein kinase